MPVSDILARPQPFMQRPTNQQIADMALEQDQARRRAIAAGDHDSALWASVERDRLCRQMSK